MKPKKPSVDANIVWKNNPLIITKEVLSICIHTIDIRGSLASPDKRVGVNYWWTAMPAMKLLGFAVETSTMLNVERSGDTWILRFQPQPAPQLKLAVPLPLVAIVKTVKVWPVTVESPHWPCDFIVAFVPVPAVLSVTLTSMLVKPHPVFPVSVICQDPDKSALVIEPILAKLGFTKTRLVTSENATTDISRFSWLFFIGFLIVNCGCIKFHLKRAQPKTAKDKHIV